MSTPPLTAPARHTPHPKSKKRLWAGRIAKLALLLSLVGTAANWRNIHMVATYNPIILAGSYDTPASLAQSRAQDIDYLSRLTRYDRSFDTAEREAFTRHLEDMRHRAGQMSHAAFYLAVSKAVALADNGHTNIDIDPLYNKFPMVDVRLAWFADGLFIVEAAGAARNLIGQRVTHIDGHTVDAVTDALRPYRGGNDVWRKNAAPSLMIAPAILFEAGIADQTDRLILSLATPDGTATDHLMMAERTAHEASTDNWTRLPVPQDQARPISLAAGRGAVEGALPARGHYIRTPTGFGTRDMPLPRFYAQTLDAIEPGSLDYLVIDFRRNSGGDYGRAVDFARRAHETVKETGTLYLVTGSDTFSAAIVTIAMIRHYSDRKVVIIGTPMGDREQFWAERGMEFRLPHSGWRIFYATGYHDWGGDCSVERYCFTRNRAFDEVAVGSLSPDVEIGETFADHLEVRDPVLDHIVAQHTTDHDGSAY
ncbi:hypothetical protein ACFFUB_09060 [Algimonas porphyrae]|uniref:Peptidase S41 n=1 Tax=Algimonas porphyrae TaxID=1128113 RepID=A0ABQ5V430_9PROT|nr:hypothetical protein [Algimonas porphyrae]GLQ21737.1 peptidase S41 [Algimonas porphyrae]